MTQLIYFIFGAIVGGVIIFVLTRKQGNGPSNSTKLIEVQAKEKEEHKKKMLEVFASKERVANDEIEKLLGVSDATVTRYLDELEKEGHIRQVGKTGRQVYYEKIGK